MDTVVLVLRSQLLRDVVRRLLTESGFHVAMEACDRVTALAVLRQADRKVDFVIVDAALCGEANGLSKELSEIIGDGRLVVLSDADGLKHITREDVAVAAGILTCDITSEAMIQALRLIQAGERVVLRDLMRSLASTNPPSDSLADGARAPGQKVKSAGSEPSPREAEILRYLLYGHSNKIIARGLGITEATVKVHLKALLRKIGVTNRTQAAIWAASNGYRQNVSSMTADLMARPS